MAQNSKDAQKRASRAERDEERQEVLRGRVGEARVRRAALPVEQFVALACHQALVHPVAEFFAWPRVRPAAQARACRPSTPRR